MTTYPNGQIPQATQLCLLEQGCLRVVFGPHNVDRHCTYSLVLIRRSDKAQCVFEAHQDAGVLAVDIPMSALAARESRWDVRLRIASAQVEVYNALLSGVSVPRNEHRHFFYGQVAEHGFSCYLTESAGSLALFVAEGDRHARMVAAENARELYPRYLKQLPLIEDLVFFESFLGKAYAGNPRYIYEALLKQRPDLRCVWSYDGDQTIPGDPIVVNRRSPDYYRYLAQARFRVNNVIFSVHGKKEETLYIQTWHGTPLKKIAFDVERPQVDARENFYKESAAWSVLLSANAYSTDIFRRAFRYQGAILETGYPLTDPLLDSHLDRARHVEALGLPLNKRFVLYAPTWRDHKPIGDWQYALDLQLELDVVSQGLPADHVLLIKAHHLVSESLDPRALPQNVIDLSHIDDISQLCVVADVLITDYSSVFFDFAVTGRPILFYCYDLALYAENLRGFYLDVHKELPGPIVETTERLVALLNDLQGVTETYSEKYQAFRQRFCSLNDGQVSGRVIDTLFGGSRGGD